MSYFRLIILIFCLGALSERVQAEEVGCNPDGGQRELNACASDNLEVADKKLAEVYDQEMKVLEERYNPVMASLEGKEAADGKGRFKASQDAWKSFRDLNCAYAAGPPVGAGYGMFLSNCQLKMDEDRIKEIKGYLHCQQSGGGGCPQ